VTIAGRRSDDLHPKAGPNARLAENYLSLVEGKPSSNYSAWSPDVPGCAATGDTIEGCVTQMKAALAFHLEGLAADGDPTPHPGGPGVYVARDPVTAA
jgi:predicted RNase H-like HicB family nuclease